MRGKIAKIDKFLEDGEHAFYKNEKYGSVLWKFWCEMEDGTKGILEKKKKELPFKVGDLVEFETKTIGKRGTIKFIDLKLVGPESGEKGASGRSYNSPAVTLPMAMSMARSIFIKLVKNTKKEEHITKEDVEDYSNIFYEWMTRGDTISDRDTLSRRWYSLEQAVDLVTCPKIGIEDQKNASGTIVKPMRILLLEYAEELFNNTMAVYVDSSSDHDEHGQD